MKAPRAHSLFQALVGEGPSFLYSGAFHDGHTARLIGMGEALAEHLGLSRAHRTKLAFIMVEAYQNIVRHRVRDIQQGAADRSMFLLRASARSQQVVAFNPLLEQDLPELTSALSRLNGKGKDELKEMFLQGLRSNTSSAKGGAGLGLIEMARRSGHPIRHQLYALANGSHRLGLEVDLGEIPQSEGPQRELPLLDLVMAEDVLLAYAGQPFPAMLEAIITLVQEDLDDRPEKAAARRSALLAATQLLDDLTGFGPAPVLLALSRDGAGYRLFIARPLPPGPASDMMEQVTALNAMDARSRQARYRHDLRTQEADRSLGLLELAYRAHGPLSAEVVPRSSGDVLFTLEIIV
ncbi:MAG: hypothetical protein IPI07_00225 [Flavobacteriales bacterium]|nr:hypothetical protein [Flavobacteriales bacterium]MBP6698263.1 SiaB family protein kinase [Flavobacteriales bacterium]